MNEKAIRRTFLFSSIGLFAISLTQKCYCTTSTCGDSIAVFLVGIIGLFAGGAALTWLANPFLLTAWITVKISPRVSLATCLLAALISISFLFFDTVIDDEAGHYNEITEYKAGYWLWLVSSVTMLAGNLVLRSRQKNKTS